MFKYFADVLSSQCSLYKFACKCFSLISFLILLAFLIEIFITAGLIIFLNYNI